MGGRPVIGITPGFDREKERSYVVDGYYEAVIEAGGLPILIPLVTVRELLEEYIEKCSGFLISGGPDFDALRFGEQNLPCNGEISPMRDELELYLIPRAIELGKPLLGICRGIQAINVAMGGTLYQDITSQIKEQTVLKHSQEAPVWYPTHDIRIEKGTTVWESFGKDSVPVNSFHHQAVKGVAPGFNVTSRSPDGLVESIELPGQFAVGVQWHPELMWRKSGSYLGIFRLLAAACK